MLWPLAQWCIDALPAPHSKMHSKMPLLPLVEIYITYTRNSLITWNGPEQGQAWRTMICPVGLASWLCFSRLHLLHISIFPGKIPKTQTQLCFATLISHKNINISLELITFAGTAPFRTVSGPLCPPLFIPVVQSLWRIALQQWHSWWNAHQMHGWTAE